MRKRLAAIMSAVVLLLAIAPSGVGAATFTLTVYGDTNFSPTSTAKSFGAVSVADLSTVPYGNGTTACPSGFIRINNPNTWYDCISSFTITNATCHQGITFYYSPNYVNPLLTEWGNVSFATIPGGYNDNFYSFQFVTRTICPLVSG